VGHEYELCLQEVLHKKTTYNEGCLYLLKFQSYQKWLKWNHWRLFFRELIGKRIDFFLKMRGSATIFLSQTQMSIVDNFSDWIKSTFLFFTVSCDQFWIMYRWDSLFAVDASCYFGPRILNLHLKRHILTRHLAFTNVNKRIRGLKVLI